MEDAHRAVASLGGEGAEPGRGVGRVAAQELGRLLDRPAGAAVLVAPVLAGRGLAGEVEVEVGGRARRASGAGEDDGGGIGGRAVELPGGGAVGEQVAQGARCVPALEPGGGRLAGRVDVRGPLQRRAQGQLDLRG